MNKTKTFHMDVYAAFMLLLLMVHLDSSTTVLYHLKYILILPLFFWAYRYMMTALSTGQTNLTNYLDEWSKKARVRTLFLPSMICYTAYLLLSFMPISFGSISFFYAEILSGWSALSLLTAYLILSSTTWPSLKFAS